MTSRLISKCRRTSSGSQDRPTNRVRMETTEGKSFFGNTGQEVVRLGRGKTRVLCLPILGHCRMCDGSNTTSRKEYVTFLLFVVYLAKLVKHLLHSAIRQVSSSQLEEYNVLCRVIPRGFRYVRVRSAIP